MWQTILPSAEICTITVASLYGIAECLNGKYKGLQFGRATIEPDMLDILQDTHYRVVCLMGLWNRR